MDQKSAQEPELSCGQVLFRGKELAYLNIGGEQMLSLAQLLSTFFPVTPRTTLFTRMEKIQARRHFCNAVEIKLLKTVGGCHGSSANCTLIPKSDVENYCETYLDQVSPPTKDVKGQAVEHFSHKKNSESSPKKSMKSPKKNNKELQPLSKSTKLTAIQEGNSSFKAKRMKKKTMVDRAVSTLGIQNKPQLKTNTKTGNSLSEFAANEMTDPNIGALEATDRHVTSATQTASMLSRLLKTKKSPKMKVDERSDNQTGVKQRKKRPLSSGCDDEKFSPPTKLHISELADCETGIRREIEFCHLAVSEVEKLERLPLHSTVSELRSPFSDVSSNDSGFSSTTSRKLSPSKNGMVTKYDEVTVKRKPPSLLKKDSPSSKIKRSPKKEIEKELWKNGGDTNSLSPPALVIRRCENTWQVETKTTKESVEKVKKKLKLDKSTKPKTAGNNNQNTDNKVISAQEAVEISNAVLAEKNVQVALSPQQREKKIVKRKVSINTTEKAEQLECETKLCQDASSVNNTEPLCETSEPKPKETEGPLIDRGIFPMKRRRRRRSKLEMQEFRQFQAAKKAAKLAGIPLTDYLHMNNLNTNLLSSQKRKKKKIGNKIGTSSEKKPSDSVDTDALQTEPTSLINPTTTSVTKVKKGLFLKPKADNELVSSHSTEISLPAGTDSTGKFTQPKKPRTDQTAPEVKMVPVKSSLKTNSKFKLNDLFNGFPMLSVQNGCLCPSYSHIYPEGDEIPGPDHFIWKWHLGGPVVDKVNKVQYKARKVRQKKSSLTSSNCVLAKAKVCKAKKLARAKSKVALPTKPMSQVNSVGNTQWKCEKKVVDTFSNATDSSLNIDLMEKSQSRPTSPVYNPPQTASSKRPSTLYSPVISMTVATPSLVTVKPVVEMFDFVDSTANASSTLANKLQAIAAES